MCSVCPEQHQHKFHHSHQLYKKSLREIDIPPRKLLSRRSTASTDIFIDSPKGEDAAFSKFLPYNNIDDEDDGSDPYSSDHFRIYEFKVRKCNRSRSHDWTDCPFAHPGEKARRRDPKRFHYSGTVCSEFRKGHCAKGDDCEFSHGVFECWLHPTRYRTEACKDEKNCKRKICFFAHSTRQLRILSDPPSPPLNSPTAAGDTSAHRRNLNYCCMHCHSVTPSPTSTLMGMSNLSPPVSPPISQPEFSRYGDGYSGVESWLGNKDSLSQLMSSLESMNVNESVPFGTGAMGMSVNMPWVDVNFNTIDEHHQFVLSPSNSSPGASRFSSGGSNNSRFFRGEYSGRNLMDESRYNNESERYNSEISSAGPDLGWVNDLLT